MDQQEILEVIIGVVSAAIVLILIIMAVVNENTGKKRRRRQYLALAEKLHYNILELETLDKQSVKEMPTLARIEKGKSKVVGYIYKNELKIRTAVFECNGISYVYIDDRLISYETNIPDFTIAKEFLSDRIAERFGAQDIDFKEYPEFSRKYVLKGADEQAIRNLFQEPVVRFFEKHEGLYMEVHNNKILIHKNKVLKPEELEYFLEEGIEFSNILRKVLQIEKT